MAAVTTTPDELASLLQQLRDLEVKEAAVEERARQLAQLSPTAESDKEDEALQQEFVSLCADTLRRNIAKVDAIIGSTTTTPSVSVQQSDDVPNISEQDLDELRQQLASFTDEEAAAFLKQLGF